MQPVSTKKSPNHTASPNIVKAISPTSARPSDVSISEDTWMEVASPQPDRTITTLQNGINLELSGNSPMRIAPTNVGDQQQTAVNIVPVPAPTQSRSAMQGNSLMNLGSVKTAVVHTPPAQVKGPSPKAKNGSVAEKIAALEKSGGKTKVAGSEVETYEISAAAPVAESIPKKAISPVKPNDHTFQQSFSFLKEETVKPIVPISKFTQNGKSALASAATEKPVKKGLFSFLAGKPKDDAIKTVPAVAHVATTAAAPVILKPAPITSLAPKPMESKQAPVMKLTPSALAIKPSLAPAPVQAPAHAPVQSADEYKIQDNDSDGDSGSGTDDDESNNKKQNRIPDWARGAQLKEALERQYGMYGHKPMDPDTIFVAQVQTCSLEEIFGANEGRSGKYSHRSSSAKWDADEITLVEKRTYRNQMGLPVN